MCFGPDVMGQTIFFISSTVFSMLHGAMHLKGSFKPAALKAHSSARHANGPEQGQIGGLHVKSTLQLPQMLLDCSANSLTKLCKWKGYLILQE